jgi:hypothetical protein
VEGAVGGRDEEGVDGAVEDLKMGGAQGTRFKGLGDPTRLLLGVFGLLNGLPDRALILR